MPTLLSIPMKTSSLVALALMGAFILVVASLFGFSTAAFAQQSLDKTCGLSNTAINCIAVKPGTNGLTVFAGCRTNASLPTLWRTFDGGATWKPVRQFSHDPVTIESIVFDGQDPQTIFVSGSHASSRDITWRTNDGGETWVGRIDRTENGRLSPVPTSVHDTTYILWEPIQHLSKSPHSESSQKMQVSGNNYSFFAQSSNDGASWGTPVVLPDSGDSYYSSNVFAVAEPYIYFLTAYRPPPLLTPTYLWFRRWTIDDSSWGAGRVLFDSTDFDFIVSQGNDVVVEYWWYGHGGGPYFAHSSDAGETWWRFEPTLPLGVPPTGRSLMGQQLYIARERGMFGNYEVTFSASTDFGATWRPEVFLSSLDTMLSYKPHLAADSTGNVFVVWMDAKYGSTTGYSTSILLRRSTDYGQTWLPEQVLTTIPSGLSPRVSVASEDVAVAWQDEVPGIPMEIKHIHCRVSYDRGVTWSNETDLTPATTYNLIPDVAIISQFVHVAWSDRSPFGDLDIYYRRGKIVITDASANVLTIPSEVRLVQNSPNPFNGETHLRFSLPRRMRVTLEVFDILGKVIAALVDEVSEAGDHFATWRSGGASSGIYFARLRAEGRIVQTKLLLIK
jgi:hypothetical protein